jgi:hypothetical protein
MAYENTWKKQQEEIARFMEDNPLVGEVTYHQLNNLEAAKKVLTSMYGVEDPIVIGKSDPHFNHFRWNGLRAAWIDNVNFMAEAMLLDNT